MILPAQTIRLLKPISPFHERTVEKGMSFGVWPAAHSAREEDANGPKTCFGFLLP